MTIFVDAFVSLFVNRLAALAEEEIVMLLGVKGNLEKLNNTLERIKPVLGNAESRKNKEEPISRWLGQLRDVMYDADDLMDDCRVEGKKRASSYAGRCHSLPLFSCLCSVCFRHGIGKRIQAIDSKLESMHRQTSTLRLLDSASNGIVRQDVRLKGRHMIPAIVDSEIVGIDEDTEVLVEHLTESNTRKSSCTVYAIAGMPGMGKTTLAQNVFKDFEKSSHFDIMMRVRVSRDYTDIDLLREIYKSIPEEDKERCEDIAQAQLVSRVGNLVKGKRFLLLLDDIWDDKIWSDYLKAPLEGGAHGSRVLITTTKVAVARGMGAVHTHEMKELSEEEGWLMLCKVVFEEDEQNVNEMWKEIGKKIVKKCKGLPLSIKTIGRLLKTMDRRTVGAWEGVCQSQTWDVADLPDDIKPGLLLSYEDLPSHLKQCFIYCSLFPEDFLFHRSNLVQMWIAEGFVEAKEELAMENVGDQYYRELAMRNLLQVSPNYYDKLGCKMLSLQRALALYMSGHEYLHRDPGGPNCSSIKPRHLSFVEKKLSVVPEINEMPECTRTLLLSRNPFIKTIPSEFFDKLRRLRVLDLSYTGIENLPDSLGNLIHLRFLNLSFTKLNGLPASIQSLSNLQTLKLNGSKNLTILPEEVVQLHNLRHLTTGAGRHQLKCMPTGIEGLKNLNTLNGFVVNARRRGGDQNVCNLKELGNLKGLANLTLYRLERVKSCAEAEEATLHNKKLTYLRLSCKYGSRQSEAVNIKEVFEGLSPSSSIESIHIEGYFGRALPDWISGISLSNLQWLRLDDCKFCQQLPPLGKLPQLKVLDVSHVSGVSAIGSEFFDDGIFPELEELYFRELTELKQWSGWRERGFPRLKKLQIIKCSKLESLPDGLSNVTCLRELVIEESESLEAIRNLNSVSELRLRRNSGLEVVSDLRALKFMTIRRCGSLRVVAGVGKLRRLVLSDPKMDVFPEWMQGLKELKKLDVEGNDYLVSQCKNGRENWLKNCKIQHVEIRSMTTKLHVLYRNTADGSFSSARSAA